MRHSHNVRGVRHSHEVSSERLLQSGRKGLLQGDMTYVKVDVRQGGRRDKVRREAFHPMRHFFKDVQGEVR